MRRRLLFWIVPLVAAAQAARGQIELPHETFAFDRDRPALGHWVGQIVPAGHTPVFAAVLIELNDEGEWTAAVTFLPARALASPGRDVRIEGGSVAFRLPTRGGVLGFSGEISADGQRMDGAVETMSREDAQPDPAALALRRVPRPVDLPRFEAFKGDLEFAGAGKLAMAIVLARTPGGNWVGHMDVPAQMLRGFPLVNITQVGDTITATLPVIDYPATIEVSLADGGRRLTGRFRQAGFDVAIDFGRDHGYVDGRLNRPQQPRPPYPYSARELRIEHSDGYVLAATLVLPAGKGPFPAAVLITGSGQQDRDETIFGHKPFLVIADYLARHGIAVLRYDDRGAGESTGADTLADATSEGFAADTATVVGYLRSIQEIDPDLIGLIGHSEGGMIAPMVAVRDRRIAFIVMLAGTAVPGREVMILQNRLLHRAAGANDATLDRIELRQREAIDLLIADEEPYLVKQAIRALIEAQRTASSQQPLPEGLDAAVDLVYKQSASPWMRFFLTYDPRPTLGKLRCPVLAVNGTRDLQVWHDQNLPEIQSVITAAGGDVTIKRYQGLNHLFQPAQTGLVAEYATIETTFDEAVLSDIVEWITSRIKR